MKRVIVGTAGHIDHGKTSLIQALTGTDCDRWAEEKERGITIDLGFAHLNEDELQIGFIDVPGHERFLHNALAGLGGIRLMLLVVAADEGVKPQTREHLDICTLLDIPDAIVVLTKADLVDADLLELAELEITELLEPTPFAHAPVLPVSSTTGDGVDRLRTKLFERAEAQAITATTSAETPAATAKPNATVASPPFRLPIDRAFHMLGLGVLVTGTTLTGKIAPGDTVAVLSAGRRIEPSTGRVRGVQVHGAARDEANAGERAALQLAGVELEAVARGTQLATPDIFRASKTLCAHLRLLADAPEPLDGWQPIRFHLLSHEVVGKMRPLGDPIAPGDRGLVEIRLAEPVVASRDDRFIIRRPSPAATLGGGTVLDPHWRRRRGAGLRAAMAAIADDTRALTLWVEETGERGCEASSLCCRLGVREPAARAHLDRLVDDGRLLRVNVGSGQRWIAPTISERVIARAKTVLETFLDADRLARGMPKAAFLAQLLPARARNLADVYLQWLAAAQVAITDGGLVSKPGRAVDLTGEESRLSKALLAAMEQGGLTPPSPPELSRALGAKPQILEGVQRYLIDDGKLVHLPTGLIVSAAAINQLRQTLADAGWTTFSVPEFKNQVGVSRKWAIPLLEHLDSIGVTRRVGDQRQVVAKN